MKIRQGIGTHIEIFAEDSYQPLDVNYNYFCDEHNYLYIKHNYMLANFNICSCFRYLEVNNCSDVIVIKWYRPFINQLLRISFIVSLISLSASIILILISLLTNNTVIFQMLAICAYTLSFSLLVFCIVCLYIFFFKDKYVTMWKESKITIN